MLPIIQNFALSPVDFIFTACKLCPIIPANSSADASLHEPPPRTTTIGPQFSGDLFLVVVTFVLNFLATFFSLVVALNNNRYTSALAQKIFTLPNMRPLSIRDPPDRRVRGSFRRL